MRQSWSNLESARRRARILARQAALSRELLESYTREFDVGSRSLLDVLNTQNALFQAEVNLRNATALEVFVKYRLLAAAGVLLPSLSILPPEDSKAYAAAAEGAPGLGLTHVKERDDARNFSKWRKSLPAE